MITNPFILKQLELLYELLNIGGCLEALITVDAPLPDPCDIEDEELKSAANRASTAAEATHISPMNADKPEGDAPKKPRKKKLEHQGGAGMPVADINVEPIRREGGTLHPFVEFIIFLVMFRSVGRNPADKSRFSLNFGVHAKTIDRITDKFLLALSFIARHYFPFPSYEEIRQSTTTALAECQREFRMFCSYRWRLHRKIYIAARNYNRIQYTVVNVQTSPYSENHRSRC